MNWRGAIVRTCNPTLSIIRTGRSALMPPFHHLARPLHLHPRPAVRQARRHRSVARQSELSAGVREAGGAEADRSDPRLARPQRSHRATSCRVARATGAPVVCMFELGLYLTDKGLQNVSDMGIGGTQEVAGVDDHDDARPCTRDRSIEDGQIVYLGGAAGFVLRAPGHADDLLRRRHRTVRRHEDDRRDLPARRSRSCRSAITTRWDRTPPRSPRAGSASARSCRCTGARSRC